MHLPGFYRRLFQAALAAIFVFGSVPAARAQPTGNDLVQASLIAESGSVRAGAPFWVGVRLRMAEHWHTYWRNPGDSGLATEIHWTLPQGFSAGPIVWPVPERIPVAHLVNYGYEGDILLLTQITPPAALPSGELPLKADVNWLVCQKECIPGEASVDLVLPGGSGDLNPDTAQAFDAARRQVPQSSPWPASMQMTGTGFTLTVMAQGLDAGRIREAVFLPHQESMIEHAAAQPLKITADRLTLQMPRGSFAAAGLPQQTGGLLLITEDTGGTQQRQAFEFTEIAYGAAPPAAAAPATATTDWLMVLQAALLAMLGGMLLNLMPCVFPVLSIKILALVSHGGQENLVLRKAQMRHHGIAYTLGILVSFAALAGLLLGLRATGAQIGWGFQLQMPLVIALLAYLLFAMGLSLSGVFHVGGSFAGIGEALTRRGGYQGSFFTGVLAAVVATPCTAPFMGAATGFALTQPAVIGIAIFVALGFGLALPFLVLTFLPQLADRLPRPGLWMERVKQALAFPLYATVAWLIWVLSQQVGQQGLLAAMIGLVLVAAAAWSFSLQGRIAVVSAAMLLLAAAGALYGTARDPVPAGMVTAQATRSPGSGAEAFSRQKLDSLVAQQKPVFVNMTAAWCITCMVNERAALSTDIVQAAFRDRNIVYMKGDWTNQDPEITRVLEQNGRSGVPLYLYYSGGRSVVLPQILTPAIVLEHLDQLDKPQKSASLTNQTIHPQR